MEKYWFYFGSKDFKGKVIGFFQDYLGIIDSLFGGKSGNKFEINMYRFMVFGKVRFLFVFLWV